MKRAFLPLLLATPLSAPAFFDDFNGPELEPHWRFFSEYGEMDYNLSDGMLHVTRINGGVSLAALLPNQENRHAPRRAAAPMDFEMTAVVGWDRGDTQYLGAGVSEDMIYSRPNPNVGAMAYFKLPGEPPVIHAGFAGRDFNRIPAPPSGMHTFRLLRYGELLEAYFDDVLVYQDRRRTYTLGRYVWIGFGGPESSAFAPLHVDSIGVVVPEPHTVGAFAIGFLLCLLRRRGPGSV